MLSNTKIFFLIDHVCFKEVAFVTLLKIKETL